MHHMHHMQGVLRVVYVERESSDWQYVVTMGGA